MLDVTGWFSNLMMISMSFILNNINSNAVVEPYSLKNDTLVLVQRTILLSQSVFQREVHDADTKVFRSDTDEARIRYGEGICYVTFRGSFGWEDQLQSFPSLFPREVCGAAGCCNVNRGIWGAYYTSYVEELEAEVAECHSRCDGEGCRVILTGTFL